MKRKDILLLTLLLSQTAPVYAMWNEDDERIMREAGNGQPRTHIQHIGFIPNLPPIVNTLDPFNSLPENLGTAQQCVLCTFGNNPPNDNNPAIEITLPTAYPLQGQWLFQEDRDKTQDIATLKLSVLLNNRLNEVFQRQVLIDHELVDSGIETPGIYYFNGDKVYQELTKPQRWKNPRTGEHYEKNQASPQGELPNHHEIVYVEPFALEGESPNLKAKPADKPKEDYRGSYRKIRDLQAQEGLSGKKVENLLYSDGKNYYLPTISQELWKQDNSQAGFFIASYKQNNCLNFVPGITIQGLPNLPQGLYELCSVQDDLHNNNRVEKWKQLGEEKEIIKITTPAAGVASIAGMGTYGPHIVSNDEAIIKALNLQNTIQDIVKKTEEARNLYPKAAGFVVVLGKTGSGKTTLINGLAGGLNAQEDEDGNLRLHANQPLSGFNIGHHAVVGTKIPGVWYNKVDNMLYWDCPGFGDPRGPEDDLVNAFAIDRIFQDSTVKVVLVTQDYDLDIRNARGQGIFKLLDEITNLFTDEQQLKDALSMVVTQGGERPQPHVRINTLQREIISAGSEIKLSDKSRRLLNFLHTNNPRLAALPQPQQEGDYPFDWTKIVTNDGKGCIGKAQPVINPKVDFKAGVGDKSKLLAGTYGQNLNDYLTNYMKTEGSQRIFNHCKMLIDDHQGTVKDLRKTFAGLVNNLQALQKLSPEVPMTFANGLRNILNVEDIEKTIAHISFLKKIKNDVTYQINDWSNALIVTIEKIQNLIAPPKVKCKGDILILKGIFIGASDVNSACKEYPKSKIVNVCGLNRFFIDEGIKQNGKSFSIISPQLRVIGKDKLIDLSGIPGEAGEVGADGTGAHGTPGQPGGNGGHFLVNAFDIEELFTTDKPRKLKFPVNTNGGSGGIGGRGGSGAKGDDGRDGDLDKRVDGPTYDVSGQRPSYTYTWNYHDKGSDGTEGADGGQGGQGGMGGEPGLSLINENPLSSKPQQGNLGDNGKTGTGGKGGVHGRNCIGTLSENIWHPKKGGPISNGPKWLVERAHVAREDGSHAASGNPGVGLNSAGQKQLDEPLNFEAFKTNTLNKYGKYFVKASTNGNLCPFMTVFPNLGKINVEYKKPEGPYKEKSKQSNGKKASSEERSEAPFKVNFKGVPLNFKVIEVPGDGDCGYHALNIEREEAAATLLTNIKNTEVSKLIAGEIEDQFFLLDYLFSTLNGYTGLKQALADIDNAIQKEQSRLDDLRKLPQSKERDLDIEEESTKLKQSEKEQQLLNQEKKAFCKHNETLKFYINHYIRPSSTEYDRTHEQYRDVKRIENPKFCWESNWLNFSPDRERGARSSAAALAHILGKNLAIWGPDGNVICEYTGANPQAETIHLLFVGNNHFSRLQPL